MSTCCAAVENDQLHVLQWLRSQVPPCPWDKSICLIAAKEENISILEWLLSQNPPCPHGMKPRA